MFPGTANTSLSCSMAWFAVKKALPPSGASMTTVPSVMPLMIRLRLVKFWALGLVPSGCSDTTAPLAVISSASEVCSLG